MTPLRPEFPPLLMQSNSLVCMIVGHRRTWVPTPGGQWELHTCHRCGDTFNWGNGLRYKAPKDDDAT